MTFTGKCRSRQGPKSDGHYFHQSEQSLAMLSDMDKQRDPPCIVFIPGPLHVGTEPVLHLASKRTNAQSGVRTGRLVRWLAPITGFRAGIATIWGALPCQSARSRFRRLNVESQKPHELFGQDAVAWEATTSFDLGQNARRMS